ncbi:ABC transporter permease [Halococcus agarilyticus]|uniref:ABC transporter permease n=1 Tax=Halococcus agarilyticus TaxID=1232219 RepID=UPI0006781621|nr:ABC transporter permease [Halococcus agarilyticus]
MSVVGLLVETWSYLLANADAFVELLREHLVLVFVSELLAIAVAVPLGVLATRNDRIRTVVGGAGNVAQTVPTLAVIALVFPILGLGFLPSVVGLFVYALLPILTNTIAGIESVDESTVNAARGMGMSDWKILRNVRLPLALPVIFAGIRTSVVLNVGTAYLAYFIGGGGLGVWVVSGIKLFNTPRLLAGAIPGALLAVALDGALALLERRLGSSATSDQVAAAG